MCAGIFSFFLLSSPYNAPFSLFSLFFFGLDADSSLYSVLSSAVGVQTCMPFLLLYLSSDGFLACAGSLCGNEDVMATLRLVLSDQYATTLYRDETLNTAVVVEGAVKA